MVAVGPMLDAVLDAVGGLDVTVAGRDHLRPFDAAGLRALAARDVVLVEPYLAGTLEPRRRRRAWPSVPHRLLALGVGRTDLHRYGSPEDHDRRHGLDPAGLRASIGDFLASD